MGLRRLIEFWEQWNISGGLFDGLVLLFLRLMGYIFYRWEETEDTYYALHYFCRGELDFCLKGKTSLLHLG